MIEALIYAVVYILVICIIAGLLVWLVRRAPFVPADFKPIIEWIIYAFAIIAVCFALLGIVRGGPVRLNLGSAAHVERIG